MELRDVTEKLRVERSCLHGSSFDDVNLKEAMFTNVTLEGASFSNLCMKNAVIEDGGLSGLAIRECDLTGMTINGILVTDLIAAYQAATPPKVG